MDKIKTILVIISMLMLIAVINYVIEGDECYASVKGITKDNYLTYEKEYKAVTNKGLVKKYCKKHYKSRTVKYTNYKPWRKSKSHVFVETIKSISDGGKHGHTKDGHYIRYNKSVKKGKSVTSYLIYNPKTKYIDDVVAVVDNQKIR